MNCSVRSISIFIPRLNSERNQEKREVSWPKSRREKRFYLRVICMYDLINKLKAGGKLREEKVGFIQIEGVLKDALKDIQEARLIIKIGERGPFLLAYQAMLKAGRALLFLEGLRPGG